jgi:type I restriction enzyme M protein
MLAPHIKKTVDQLWNRFWSAGLTNPLVAVEQITYLLFLKRLEDIDAQRQKRGLTSIYVGHENCKWSYIRQEKTKPDHLIEVVFPWLRNLNTQLDRVDGDATELSSLDNRMSDAYFQLDRNKGQVLSDAIDKIDQLFARVGDGSAAQDVMGDTFEYLLSEVASAGKNGQFRTPRHLIRFMVELLDPEPNQRIIDPAAGTGGFLFSAQQYLMRKYSDLDNLKLEWDGTPHHADGSSATPTQDKAIHNGNNFVGLDNDRTMARIGWMNLVLHDVNDPHLEQGDALSKRAGKEKLTQLLASESYDFVLANPPFTGTVDTSDLEPDSVLFPRVGGGGKKKEDTITNKSELLFLWLMLDLLKVGGRCAVIIPEGVLFGNTEAHVKLRRELLTEHVVEAVISLPGGVFQPYTGVKTSILIFRKETKRTGKETLGSQAPRTQSVWFYEVQQDGYTLDAKRNPRPAQPNDLWDALVKYKAWQGGKDAEGKTYFQPQFHQERWRQALLRGADDKLTPAGEAFSGLADAASWDGKVWGNHELFTELPADPKEAEKQIKDKIGGQLHIWVADHFYVITEKIWSWHVVRNTSESQLLDEWRKAAKAPEASFKKCAREAEKYFEKEDSPALTIWRDLVKEALGNIQTDTYVLGALQGNRPPKLLAEPLTEDALTQAIQGVAREVAKLDGFDVHLRSIAIDVETTVEAAKHWVKPVREWLVNDDWQSADGKQKCSHDKQGAVRPVYVQAMLDAGLYDEKDNLKEGLLDPDCIEARSWNLSAGQYKPFDFMQLKSDKSVTELIGELRSTETQIVEGLDKLLAMVEGRE